MNKRHAHVKTALIGAALLCASMLWPAFAQAQLVAPGATASAPHQQFLAPNDPNNTFHLTQDQWKKAAAIESTFEKSVLSLRDNKSMTDTQKVAKYRQYQTAARDSFSGMLTPSQRAIFDQKQKQEQTYGKGSADARQKAEAIRKSFLASLNPSQLNKWNEFNQSGAAQLGAIENNKTMTDQQKGLKAKALRVSMQAKLKTFLSAKQLSMLSDFEQNYANAATLARLAEESAN